ncbi:heme oxygenase [Coniochaeta pulveracea]|uniref:Heme oxygenase n=1 Tax=Coniochaeta pulveracea TaxID=177199 RepID=A0A420Y3K8_9PEZI|nr:heme oxygenase [Coniochaeta pulveracea]
MADKGKDVFVGDAINAATRSVHTKLNKLILMRLPLAIPPRATDTSAYVSGILHIAPLYICFESLWHAAIHADSPTNSLDQQECAFSLPSTSNSSPNLPQPSPRIHSILAALYIPGLLRSARLRSDLASLTSQSETEIQRRLENVASTGRLGEMVSHIQRSVSRHPHVLLSYAWVLYMALFSGGRFIRATLENAGRANPNLWGHAKPSSSSQLAEAQTPFQRKSSTMASTHGPLQFFHFPTPQDGEDLKVEFKSRLAEQGKLLTRGEVEDIVKEAQCIFENLILVIGQLDDVCHTSMNDLRSPLEELANPFGSPGTGEKGSGFRIRDSVLVAKERAARRTGSSYDEGSGDVREEGDEMEEEALTSSESSSFSSSSKGGNAEEQEDPAVDVEPDFAARLEKAVHFDHKIPTPDRTASGNVLLLGNAKAKQRQNDGAEDEEQPRGLASKAKKSLGLNSNMVSNVAVGVGSLVLALGVIYLRH